MTEEASGSSKISNPESVARLVAKMCDGSMQVLMRHRDSGNVTIRGAFHKLGKFRQNNAILLNKMSEAGLSKLDIGMPIKIEVLGMASQLTFQTLVIEKMPSGIVCAMPRSLISTERRTNARFRTTNDLTAFMSFSFWKAQQQDLASQPYFSAYGGIAHWISVADISAGGVCLVTRFPAFLNASEGLSETFDCALHIPMAIPLKMTGVIRWRRKIRNRVELEGGGERFQLEYRIGLEFAVVGEEEQQKIRQYMRQLTVAEAI